MVTLIAKNHGPLLAIISDFNNGNSPTNTNTLAVKIIENSSNNEDQQITVHQQYDEVLMCSVIEIGNLKWHSVEIKSSQTEQTAETESITTPFSRKYVALSEPAFRDGLVSVNSSYSPDSDSIPSCILINCLLLLLLLLIIAFLPDLVRLHLPKAVFSTHHVIAG
uniref:Uncharacterized protein n=1 Tax=Glossina pallidipes TaxID=7398 RepID=A0A1B0ACH9_GLOPL